VNLLDDEVFAVILAVVVVASVFAAAQEFRRTEPFNAIGLLNENCQIGEYPSFALTGENLTLCIYVSNQMGIPEAFKVVYRFGNIDALPTNTTPSTAPELWSRIIVLDSGQDSLLKYAFPIPNSPELIGTNATLIFELWMYNATSGLWEYTGRWVDLNLRVVGVPLS